MEQGRVGARKALQLGIRVVKIQASQALLGLDDFGAVHADLVLGVEGEP